jgi:hypothetical protein
VLEGIGLISPARTWSRRRPWRRISTTEHAVFPYAATISRHEWDLNEPTERHFDLLVASNVFMYSHDPERWFANVLESCAYFLLIDLVRRQRSRQTEFGRDGDCLRFAFGEERPRVSNVFELGILGDRLLEGKTYPGGANEFDSAPLHVIALIGGHTTLAAESGSAAAIHAARREFSSGTD